MKIGRKSVCFSTMNLKFSRQFTYEIGPRVLQIKKNLFRDLFLGLFFVKKLATILLIHLEAFDKIANIAEIWRQIDNQFVRLSKGNFCWKICEKCVCCFIEIPIFLAGNSTLNIWKVIIILHKINLYTKIDSKTHNLLRN